MLKVYVIPVLQIINQLYGSLSFIGNNYNYNFRQMLSIISRIFVYIFSIRIQ
ncbi:hypothetical protein FDUTEX481_05473 [Tolypothrix sp. PCC 7601]|nr:hypothetical protein FDUTEX481_05473 [Tolypothrix sp. PCC 7601]